MSYSIAAAKSKKSAWSPKEQKFDHNAPMLSKLETPERVRDEQRHRSNRMGFMRYIESSIRSLAVGR